MKVAVRFAVLAVLALLVATAASAQLAKGFRGRVLDKNGKPMADIKVVIEDAGNPLNHYELKTSAEGSFMQAGVPYSDKGYKITIYPPDLPPATKQEMGRLMDMIEVNFDIRKDYVMKQSEIKANPAADAKQMYDLNDYEGAVTKANEAIASKDIDKDSLKAAKLIKATSLQKLDRPDDAIAAYEDFNTNYPGDVTVLGILYNLYDKKGDKAKAEIYKKEYIAKGGQVTGMTYNDGVKLLNEGNAQQAAPLFQQAIKENPADPDAHRELARCYAQEGKFQETIDELRVYLKMKPNADDAETWKQAIAGLEQAIEQQKKQKK